MNRIYIIIIIFVVFTTSCQDKVYEIQQSNVERIVKYLASDELAGRQSMQPEIDSAAAFIAAEFKEIGLEFWNEQDSYYQEFSLYNLTPMGGKVLIDQAELEADHYFYQTSQEEWEGSFSMEEALIISEDDNFREKMSNFNSSGQKWILADTAHKEIFNRYAAFYKRPNSTENLSDIDEMLVVLSPVNSMQNVSFELSTEKQEQKLKNVVGILPGNRINEKVMFSAHYDHIGIIKAQNGDSIANGANDDASGTAAVIELARYYASKPSQPERSLIFVAFTAEEMGLIGSRNFSSQIDPDQVVAMFNIEMIGKPSSKGINSAWITGFDQSSLGEILQSSVTDSSYLFYPDPYIDYNLFYRSDNATLARLGVPAHSISTTPIDVDKDYHQVSDEFETLNMDHLTATIKAIAKGSEIIVSGKETPTRVDPEKVK